MIKNKRLQVMDYPILQPFIFMMFILLESYQYVSGGVLLQIR